MPETFTISREKPTIKSMDFAFLKEEGIKRLQELAGEIWTDYNEHDPGVTILEVLCYALTDLGYRTSFDMKDLLAPNPIDGIDDEYDFFTARQILHNNPLTIEDYRKLLMDVSVRADANDPNSEILGIKNAWIRVANSSEHAVYADKDQSRLQYEPPKLGDPTPLDLSLLYEVVLEFTDSKTFGDLNTDINRSDFLAFHPNVTAFFRGEPVDPDLPMALYDQDLLQRLQSMSEEELELARAQAGELLDLTVVASVEFPRWDDLDVDWSNIDTIKSAIQKINLVFLGLPSNMDIRYKVNEDNDILLASGKDQLKDRPVPFIDDITTRVNCLIVGRVDSLLHNYQQRVLKILEILAKARARLHAHRNLCEDFLQFSALRVEDILLCADIEIDPNADVVEVEAQIYFLVNQFLSPTVKFYGLNEIRSLDLDDRKFEVLRIDKERNVIVVPSNLRQSLDQGDSITMSGFGTVDQFFNVSSIAANELEPSYTDIGVVEELADLREQEGAFLFLGVLDPEDLRPVEEVMIGPALDNGFIDDEELKTADLRSVLHASDLINLILDVPGVKTIRKLEMANVAQDENEDVPSRSVKWCLNLAVDQNYIPRLNTERSKITFLKDSLPIGTDLIAVTRRLEELEEAERPRVLPNPELDYAVPQGEYRELEDYVSIQQDFPLIYGVGPEGVPLDCLEPKEVARRQAQAQQLKGFLTIFDQLLANYLAQLEHFKNLFSFNPQLKAQRDGGDVLPDEYNFQVNKTYFSQSIYDIIPNGNELYHRLLEAGDLPLAKETHDNELQWLTEDTPTFITRRNRFLDHLMARFAEQVTEYALLAGRIDGPKAPLELIEDKQDFLSRYPDLSGNRGKAFDYRSTHFWHPDNVSGLAKRVSFFNGIDPMTPETLAFNPEVIEISQSQGGAEFWSVIDEADTLLRGRNGYTDRTALNLELERVILCGSCEENYQYVCRRVEGQNSYSLILSSDGELLGSMADAFTTREELQEGIDRLVGRFQQELLDNPLANRNNLALPLDSFFVHELRDEDIDVAQRRYLVTYRLYAAPFRFDNQHLVLEGTLDEQSTSLDIDTLEELRAEALRRVREVYWDIVFLGGSQGRFAIINDRVNITDRLGEPMASGSVTDVNTVLVGITVADGTVEQQAIERLRLFLQQTFFRQEGLHVVEHILLRPKINDLWVEATADTMQHIPNETAIIPFDERFNETPYQLFSRSLLIGGDVTDKLKVNTKITVSLDREPITVEAGSFQFINRVTERFPEGYTSINLRRSSIGRRRPVGFDREVFDLAVFAQGTGVSIQQFYRISNVNEAQLQFSIRGLTTIQADDEFIVYAANLRDSFGTFRAIYVEEADGDTTITVNEFKVQDKLLPIHIPTPNNDIVGDADCEACKVSDPYSHIAHVVVAAWPGRFNNLDFRSFFERSLRQEAPAHVFLNICWIGPDQMEKFERLYKRWLMLNKQALPRAPFDEAEEAFLKDLSMAQNQLVQVLDELRNVYPVRTLHDCEESDSTDGAIILNQTALGEI